MPNNHDLLLIALHSTLYYVGSILWVNFTLGRVSKCGGGAVWYLSITQDYDVKALNMNTAANSLSHFQTGNRMCRQGQNQLGYFMLLALGWVSLVAESTLQPLILLTGIAGHSYS